MAGPPRIRLLVSVAVATALVGVGCSDDDDSGTPKASTTDTAQSVPEEPTGGKAAAKRRAEAKGKRRTRGTSPKPKVSKAELEKERRAIKREAAEDRKADREFDRSFSETPFEKIVAKLPIRKPPLFVEQYITSKGSTTVYTAVALKRFFCGRSPARRKAAVSSFYRDADKVFRRMGVRDFVQVVTPVAETTERLPALAVGRGGKVTLTKRGRAKGPC